MLDERSIKAGISEELVLRTVLRKVVRLCLANLQISSMLRGVQADMKEAGIVLSIFVV